MFSAPDTETPVVVFVTIKFLNTMFEAPAWNWNAMFRTVQLLPNSDPFAARFVLPMICTALVSVPESPAVSTGSIVEWSVAGLPDWLSVSSASMTGPGSVILAAAANTSVQPRSGTIRIADHEFHVSQKGRGVSIGYDETKVFDTDGKTTGDSTENVISVTADPDVQWTAVASAPTWIVVYEGATGTGTGTVKFIVAPYVGSGEIRTGLITIGSEIVYVTQRPYELSIEPNGTWVDGNAGAGEIQVALDIAGVWNAIATEPWIMIVSGYDAGTGNGKVLFSYTDNNTGRQRTGKIIVAGETYTLTQAARQNFAVTATAGRGGHVAGGGIYGLDAAIELEAVPEGGYAFDHWALPGGGTSTENPLAVTVTAAQSYQAVFVPADPGLVVASASLKGVKLAWADLPWATELRVFRGTSSNRSQATRIATLANDGSCEWLDATGAENQTYWYWIEAIGDEEDVWSGAVRGTRAKATFAIDYTNLRGTTHSNPATYVEGSTVSFAPPSSRTGFTFEGWTPTGITADTSGDVTVRANWEQNEYTVRFDLGGAAGSMADEPFTYGLWKYLSPTNFSRTGYTFVGWAVKPSAAAAVYDDSESVKSLTAERNETVTLYALWRRENLDDPLPDLGTSATSSDIIAVFVGTADAARLGENITSAAEYADFRAWADSVRDGSGAPAGHEGVSTSPHAWLSYALGQESLLEAAPGEGDLVILDFGVAESGASRFDLTFGLDGITVGDSAKPANLAKTFAIEGTEFLEDGFSEDAVALLSIGPSEGAVATSVEPESDADSFFFRVVERPEQTAGRYTISFNSAGGSAVAPISQEYGTAVATPAAPTRTGYTFAGWIPAVPATMPAGNRTLTAQWTPKQYTVSFDSAGGSAVSPISQGYTSAITPPVDPTRIGYTFAGWSPAIPATMPTTNTTCVAQWTPNHYTIRFIANGGSGAMGDLDVAYDETVSLSPVGFTGPGGAAFIGWSTTPDGLVEYIDEAEVRNLSVEDGAIIPVYAKWDRGSFTVHFDANGGTGEMPDQVFTLDVSLNLATNLFVKTNSVFVGWSTNGTDDVFFVDGESVANLVVVGETVTLRAVWAPLYCIVDLSGGADASSYPVTHPDELPVDGFNTDEYKTTKLVLRRLEPGPIPTREATITKPFFVGLFEVTQRQWELVMGTRPSYFSNDSYYATRPVERVSYDMIRGSSLGAQWPTSNVVDANSFLGKLRTRTGLDFDLPTEAQWEYACRAGTPTDYNNGKNGTTSSQDAAMDEVGRYWFNGGSAGWQNSSCSTTNGTAAAGSYLPNVWGLYDMHGNVWEWCLDWYGDSLSGTDPVGPSSGEERVMRGGAYSSWASDCVSSYRDCCPPTSVYFTRFGFRLVRSLSN